MSTHEQAAYKWYTRYQGAERLGLSLLIECLAGQESSVLVAVQSEPGSLTLHRRVIVE